MKRFSVKVLSIIVLLFGVWWITVSDARALDEETTEWVEEARKALSEITGEKVVMALVYLSDEYPIRQEPSSSGAVVQMVRTGQQVQIKDVYVDDGYEVWSYVTGYYGETEFSGYVPRNMLACSDMDFLLWEDSYGMNPSGRSTYSVNSEGQAFYADIETFPESYREALTALKEAHPNWTFVKMDTGLDWNSSVNAQMQGARSLVPDSYPEYMKNGPYGAGWSYASDSILAYHMDPRNFLQESTIFQFELLTYNDTYHTVDAVQLFLDNTFMRGKPAGFDITYAQIIQAHGKDLGISPFHMAARIYQEQGNGTSELISGTYEGLNGTLKGYYNFFNVQASGATREEIIINGLTYAKNAKDVKNPSLPRPWTDAYWSIQGGAYLISSNYILKGQDTLYLQKFNVNTGSPYGAHNHQYMQNIVAPQSEGKNIRKLYKNAGSLENTFVFKIPVFNNMPETAAPYPTAPPDPTPVIKEFVTRMYQQCLSREPDEDGLNGWVSQLKAGHMNGAQIAEQFVFSNEMLTKNLSNGDFVDVLYRSMMGREADEDGKCGWVGELDGGHKTRSEVTKFFVESTEFKRICNGYEIISGGYDASHAPIERFVTRFYTLCLERNPDQAGLYGWVGQLKNGHMNGAQLAEQFVFSEELIRKNISDEKFVELLYNTLMGRTPDEEGFRGWVGQLEGGQKTRWEIMKAFIESPEFTWICETYGIIRGSLE